MTEPIKLSPNDVRRIVISGEWPTKPLYYAGGEVPITDIEVWLAAVAEHQAALGRPTDPDHVCIDFYPE